MPRKKTYHLVTMGCAKNEVDSDSMGQIMDDGGYRRIDDPARAQVLILNTCGFIESARQQTYEELKKMADAKRPGQLLIAAGCLTQRFGAEVVRDVPGVDGILGARRWMDILDLVQRLRQGGNPAPLYHLPPDARKVGTDERGALRAAQSGTSAYLKIADGCRRPCAFCSIPLIKGSTVSRPLATIVHEARQLRDRGVREIILVAQDTTDYGYDLGMKDGLVTLLDGLVDAVPDMDWFRILYAYPGYVTDRLIDFMAANPQVLPYLDIPLQHAHPDILRRMKRPANMDWVHRTLEKLRHSLPNVAIRTTFIVGYPGETDLEFQTLLDFTTRVRFDRVGVFEFSFEPGAASEPLGDPVPVRIKADRSQELMSLQRGISHQINQSQVGRTLHVLVEGRDRDTAVGRSYRDAPEIDGLVLFDGPARIGDIVPVRITGALPYDLSGTQVGQH